MNSTSSRKLIPPIVAFLIYILLLAVCGLLVVYLHLLQYLALVLVIPVVLSPFFYRRGWYIAGLATLTVVELVSVYATNGDWGPSFLALGFIIPGGVIVAEFIHFETLNQHKIEIALQESELKFRRFIQQSEDGIFLVDEKGIIIEWNRIQEQISGLKQSETIGRPYWDIIFKMLPNGQKTRANHEKYKALMSDFLRMGHLPGMNEMIERQIQRPNGTMANIQEVVFPIKTDQGFMAGNIIRDVTDRRQVEQQLKEANDKLTGGVAELQAHEQETTLLNDMGEMLQSCLSVEDAYGVVGQFAEKIFPQQSGVLFVLNGARNFFEEVSVWGQPARAETEFASEVCWTLRRGRSYLVDDPNNRLICQHLGLARDGAKFVPHVCIPMTAQGETFGVLHIQGRTGQSMEELETRAGPMAARVALALANLRLRESLRSQSIRDPLTGLFNRRYMEETLERELHRAARHQHPLGVIMIDIDYFKRFNDTFGHETGDVLLRELGTFLRANVRSEDVPCRYGGEEFIIILPEASVLDVQKRTMVLRDGIKSLKIQRHGQIIGPITVSQGVASFPEHGASAGQLLRAVDAALYKAKRGGRDQVVVAEV